MWSTAEWQETLEPAFVARSLCETWVCRKHFSRNDPQGFEKNELKPWLKEQWCIPPQANAAFVCQMEDVLEVYKLPYDIQRPVICMDEMPKQLLSQTCDPIPCQAGKPAREDYEYKRNGVADLFMVFEPLQ